MSSVLRFALRTSLLCVLVLPTALRADELCSALTKIKDAAAGRFSSVEGSPLGDDHWRATLTVPGFAGCQIAIVNDSRSLLCYSAPLAGAAEASAHARDVATRLAKCEGDAEVLHAQIGDTVLETVSSSSSSVGLGTSSTPWIVDPASRRVTTGWSTQLTVSLREDRKSRPRREIPARAAPKEEMSKPLQFELRAKSLCDTVRKVVAASTTKFEKIRGAAVNQNTWKTSVRPDRAFDCDINYIAATGTYYYQCSLLQTTSETSARGALDQVQDAVATCLGDRWIQEKATEGSEVRYRFTNDDVGSRVNVNLTEFDERWGLRVTVWSPLR